MPKHPPYEKRGQLPKRVWDRRAARELAQVIQATVEHRAFDEGHGLDDRPHKAYSTRRLWVANKGVQPKARGGRRTRVRNPKTGRMNYGKGRVYDDGYRQYKRESTGTDHVNLTATGRMRRSFRIKAVLRTRIIIGLTGAAAVYGTFVNRRRPWIGLSRKDRQKIARALPRIIARARARAVGGRIV